MFSFFSNKLALHQEKQETAMFRALISVCTVIRLNDAEVIKRSLVNQYNSLDRFKSTQWSYYFKLVDSIKESHKTGSENKDLILSSVLSKLSNQTGFIKELNNKLISSFIDDYLRFFNRL